DGPTIQKSSTLALENGMTTELLFKQLENIRKSVKIPLLIMGYFNPIYQFGIEVFCKKCNSIGIDGLIIPDLPLKEYQEQYKDIFESNNLKNIFLITPQTSNQRIREIDAISNSFIYMVSSASVTGNSTNFGDKEIQYFKRISELNLKNQQIIGFGINSKETFNKAIHYQKGAIIGSEFIKYISKNSISKIKYFINNLL
ncbi:MAG: tryptophan synthase subunit alpha, partial [Flavobacterium sp.]